MFGFACLPTVVALLSQSSLHSILRVQALICIGLTITSSLRQWCTNQNVAQVHVGPIILYLAFSPFFSTLYQVMGLFSLGTLVTLYERRCQVNESGSLRLAWLVLVFPAMTQPRFSRNLTEFLIHSWIEAVTALFLWGLVLFIILRHQQRDHREIWA